MAVKPAPRKETAREPRKIVTYLIEPHTADCHYFGPNASKDRSPWVLPESTGITPLGHKKRKHLYVFRCNNHSCPAKLGISSDVFHRVWDRLLRHVRYKGAPKRRKAVRA